MKDVSFNDAYVFLDSLPSIEKDIMELIFTSDIRINDADFAAIVSRAIGIDYNKAIYRQNRLIAKLKRFRKQKYFFKTP